MDNHSVKIKHQLYGTLSNKRSSKADVVFYLAVCNLILLQVEKSIDDNRSTVIYLTVVLISNYRTH